MSKTTDHAINVQNADMELEEQRTMQAVDRLNAIAEMILEDPWYPEESDYESDEEYYDDDHHGQRTRNAQIYQDIFGGPF